MECQAVQSALLGYLWQAPRAPLAAAIVEHIAGCASCWAAFAEMDEALGGEPSPLRASVRAPLTCAACQERLPAYVEDEVAGAAVSALYADAARHLARCANCREQHDLLLELAQASLAGALPPAPSLIPVEAEPRSEPVPALIWQKLTDGIYDLIAGLNLKITSGLATFQNPFQGLVPQLVPIPVRADPSAERFAQVLELPQPETNTLIRVETGPVADGRATVLVTLAELLPPRPLPGVRISLLEEGDLLSELERTATNASGVAIFRDLEPGRYVVRAERGGQAWQFALRLARDAS